MTLRASYACMRACALIEAASGDIDRAVSELTDSGLSTGSQEVTELIGMLHKLRDLDGRCWDRAHDCAADALGIPASDPDIRRCPFCGGEGSVCSDPVCDDPQMDSYYVKCRRCGAETEWMDSSMEALQAWDRRYR